MEGVNASSGVIDEGLVSFKELQANYQTLLAENRLLKEELKTLKAGLGVTGLERQKEPCFSREPDPNYESMVQQSSAEPCSPTICNRSESAEKIRLFMSLFKGRDDVYARRWENKKKGTSGYSPACLNEWKQGVCGKPKVACSKCGHKSYAPLDESVIDNHLRGNNMLAGIYPMLRDETCWFLAIDFDDGDWQKDISALKDVCMTFGIPVAVERSRSGNGGHVWLFFDNSNFLPVFNNDILAAQREILIVSPFVTRRRTVQMMQHLEIALRNGIRVIVVTRPAEDYREMDQTALQGTFAILQDAGVKMIFRSNIHQKFAGLDQRVVWYGSINLLSFGSAEESIMRLENPNIANELMKTVNNSRGYKRFLKN